MMEEALPWLAAALEGGGRVLVHCQQGKSRSAAVVAAYLLRSAPAAAAEATAADALAAVDAVLLRMRRARPMAAPNAGFMDQLRARPWDKSDT